MIILKKDGKEVSRGVSDIIVFEYIHKHSSYSVSTACKYDGYTVEIDGINRTSEFI